MGHRSVGIQLWWPCGWARPRTGLNMSVNHTHLLTSVRVMVAYWSSNRHHGNDTVVCECVYWMSQMKQTEIYTHPHTHTHTYIQSDLVYTNNLAPIKMRSDCKNMRSTKSFWIENDRKRLPKSVFGLWGIRIKKAQINEADYRSLYINIYIYYILHIMRVTANMSNGIRRMGCECIQVKTADF